MPKKNLHSYVLDETACISWYHKLLFPIHECDHASLVFHRVPRPSTFIWTAMINGVWSRANWRHIWSISLNAWETCDILALTFSYRLCIRDDGFEFTWIGMGWNWMRLWPCKEGGERNFLNWEIITHGIVS